MIWLVEYIYSKGIWAAIILWSYRSKIAEVNQDDISTSHRDMYYLVVIDLSERSLSVRHPVM